MQNLYAWAKQPMIPRIQSDLDSEIPVSLIFGGNSWNYTMNPSVMDQFSEARPEGSYVGTYLVEEASHHVHADKPAQFNDCVRDILKIVDFGG